MFYQIIKHTHSGLRWILLLLLVVTVFSVVIKVIRKGKYSTVDQKLGMFTMSFTHIQLLIGLLLYFISGKVVFSMQSMSNDLLRFFLVEHIGLMLVAVALITIGYVKVKKLTESRMKLKTSLIFYGVALLLILIAIPWPWQLYSAAWF